MALNTCQVIRPYLYARYWTGTSLQLRLIGRNIIKNEKFHLHLKRLPALVVNLFQCNTENTNIAKRKKLAFVVRVPQITENLVISSCFFYCV